MEDREHVANQESLENEDLQARPAPLAREEALVQPVNQA